LYRACHATCIFVDPLQMSHAWFLFNYYKILTFCLTGKVHNPLRLPQKMLIERPKVVRASGAFSSLTSKCASRHNGVRFCWTSELPKVLRSWRVLNLLCFQNVLRATTPRTFSTSQLPKVFQAWCAFSILTWEICFAPQPRALFPLNFQTCSEHVMLCTCSSRQNAVHFSTCQLQLPKVLRTFFHSDPQLIVDWKLCGKPTPPITNHFWRLISGKSLSTGFEFGHPRFRKISGNYQYKTSWDKPPLWDPFRESRLCKLKRVG
jgi:hypothetical protein